MKDYYSTPPDELEECEVFCPQCKEFLDYTDIIYFRDDEIIGCELCIGKMELGEWMEEHTPSEEDILADKADMERDER